MPYRKTNRRTTRKSYRKPRYTKRYRRKMITGNPRQKVFYYKRVVKLANFVAGADGANTFQNYMFILTDVPNYTDFTNLYDFYKIAAVKLNILPVYSGVDASSIASGAIGSYNSWSSMRFFSCIDYNGNTTPTTIDTIRSYQNCKTSRYITGHRRYAKFYNSYEGSNGVGGYGKNSSWYRTNEPNVEYGVFMIALDTSLLDPSVTATSSLLAQVEATYYLAFKSPQ